MRRPATSGAAVKSADWAGYAALADKGMHFRYVAAKFTIPGPGCGFTDAPDAYVTDSQWVGLDGYHGGTAEQIGVSESCEVNFPYITYDAWYRGASGSGDFLSCVEPGGDCPKGPDQGDKIQISVFFNGKTDPPRLLTRSRLSQTTGLSLMTFTVFG